VFWIEFISKEDFIQSLDTLLFHRSSTNQEPSMNDPNTTAGSHSYIDEKWDAALDVTLRRVVYGSMAGGLAALVLFRSGSARAAVTAFGAGFGAGSSYNENQAMFEKALKGGNI